MVRGSMPCQRKERRHHGKSVRHRDSEGDWHQQPSAQAQAPLGHPGNGVPDESLSTRQHPLSKAVNQHEATLTANIASVRPGSRKRLTCLLFVQSTSNIWMTHAEMESLTAATKPVRSDSILLFQFTFFLGNNLICLTVFCVFFHCLFDVLALILFLFPFSLIRQAFSFFPLIFSQNLFLCDVFPTNSY